MWQPEPAQNLGPWEEQRRLRGATVVGSRRPDPAGPSFHTNRGAQLPLLRRGTLGVSTEQEQGLWGGGVPRGPGTAPPSPSPHPRPGPRAGELEHPTGVGVREGQVADAAFLKHTRPSEGWLPPGRGQRPRAAGPTSLSVSRKSPGYTSCGDTEHSVRPGGCGAGPRVCCPAPAPVPAGAHGPRASSAFRAQAPPGTRLLRTPLALAGTHLGELPTPFLPPLPPGCSPRLGAAAPWAAGRPWPVCRNPGPHSRKWLGPSLRGPGSQGQHPEPPAPCICQVLR